jgi:hypothetical protein
MTISANQEGNKENLLGRLPRALLELSAHKAIEFLVNATEFNIGFDGY